MIQDIAPHRFDNAYAEHQPRPEDRIFLFDGEEMLAAAGKAVAFPQLSDFVSLDGDLTYLFALDETRYFLARHFDRERVVCPGYQWVSSNLRGAQPMVMSFIGLTAKQLWRWYQTNLYCSRCGEWLAHDKKERMLFCSHCGNTVYPKISPCVIVGITNGNKLLLTRYARAAYKRYALVAGFCEIGESFEATVRREVAEEVGLKVTNIRYWKSQPWALSDTMLAGFFCDVDGDPTPTLVDGELGEATWFEREEIPCEDDGFSLTRAMITLFKNGQEPK